MRIGYGYDIHRLVAGRPLCLGCVVVPHERGLLGHSDADVVAHAIADAALGAAGLGDLGANFPDTEARWKGVSGADLLRETSARLRARGLVIEQADVTIVAEAPRLAPYRDAMIATVAAALGCTAADVSIKARTNEGLDAIGRGEAIAAHAVVLLGHANRGAPPP